MTYGYVARNAQGEVILDDQTPVLCLAESSQNVSPINASGWQDGGYRPDATGPVIFAFQINSSMNVLEFVNTIGVEFNNSGNYILPNVIFFNGGQKFGSKEFKMITSSDLIPPEPGSYGLNLFDESGKRIYTYSNRLLKLDSVLDCRKGDSVSIPNDKWLCCFFINNTGVTSSYLDYWRLERVGTSNQWNCVWPSAGNGTFMALMGVFTI